MDRRRKALVVVVIAAPLFIATALPFVSGCGDDSGSAPVVQRTVRHTTTQGTITKVEYSDGSFAYRRGNGPEYGRGASEFGTLEAEFNASGKALDSASRAAAERDKGLPAQTGNGTQAMQPVGPKVDLPTQHTPHTYQPPSTPTPTPYTPPGGGTYHPPH